MSLGRFTAVFAAAFPLFYVPALVWNWPLFSYLPRSHEFHLLMYAVPPVRAPGPGMYFWGWMLTAAIGAAIVALIASFVPEKIASRCSVGWVPVFLIGGVFAIIFALRQWWVFG